MKKIAFTICSNNYVAQAKILLKSLYKTNPDYALVLGLVDKKRPDIDYNIEGSNIEIVEVELLNIPEKYNIFQKYNIVELNTSVKATYIKWLQKKYNADIVLYFDPDIKVFSSLSVIESSLIKKSVVLTPHIYNPIPLDNLNPNENKFLHHGIFNLGFIGVSFKNECVFNFLNWWEERLLIQCFSSFKKGLFVDQLPITLSIVIFSSLIEVLFHYGMNVAPWNLHERKITLIKSNYYVNSDNLIFFHFSNISFAKGQHPVYNRYEIYPILEDLYENYREELVNNKFVEYKKIKCFYQKNRYARIIWKIIKGLY